MTKALIVGTGPSLRQQLHLIPRFDGLVFTCNNAWRDVRTDAGTIRTNVWLACDPAWHKLFGKQEIANADCWHWDADICHRYGYKHVEGIWMDGLYLGPENKISLNHCSGAQLLNLAANQYACDEIILIGHDFHYPAGAPRHYFNDLSDVAGEYPAALRKWSEFDKRGKGHDLMQVYRAIADQPGRPPILNATPESKLGCFPMVDFEDYLI